MKISVIIPTFNRAAFLKDAIDSILLQTFLPDEIIIVDDGSTDNTKDLVKEYDVKYFYQENQGVSSARNLGIKETKNDWIVFLDSDDIFTSDKLKTQIDFHLQNPHILISHTDELWIRDGKRVKQKSRHEKPSGVCFLENISFCKIGPSTVMVHKSIFEKVGVFDEALPLCEDYDLWLRILKDYEIGLIDEKLTHKRAGHGDQLSFSTYGLDRFRIAALEKHIHSEYKNEVLNELIKKCEILVKGALKNGNSEIYELYDKKLGEFTKLI